MKTIYKESADDFRILAGKEPDFAAGINSIHNACQFRTDCQKAEAEIARLRADAERMDELQSRFLALDSDWGERKETVLIIRWDSNFRVSNSLRAAIDAARKDTK
jgi:hypothetical protein